MRRSSLHGTCHWGLYSLHKAQRGSFPDRRPVCMSPHSITIIGAGLASWTAAHIVGQLQQRPGEEML